MVSIWEREAYYYNTDVCIAGGGLMALWTALELVQKNPALKIIIAEAMPLPALASTRNAGFACFGSPTELWADKELMAEDWIWELATMRFKGISKIRETLGDTAIGYDDCGGYEVFPNDNAWKGKQLTEKLDWLNEGFKKITGLSETYKLCNDLLGSMQLTGFENMVGNSLEGGLHSGKLVKALIQLIQHLGVTYLTGHAVKSANRQGDRWQIVLEKMEGKEVEVISSTMVWATNASLSKAFPKKVAPARGQIILSPPIPDFRLQGTFHFDEGYYYFRNYENRLLLGGARNTAFDTENTLAAEPTHPVRTALEDFIQQHIPQAYEVIHHAGWLHWAGIMGMSASKKPEVWSNRPGEWQLLACNGMGVALTPVMGEIAAAAVLTYLQ